MNLLAYLCVGGNCRQAFECYAAERGGPITMPSTHPGQPNAERVPLGRRIVMAAAGS